ncbi:coiled-coil-helix-coiled-coil-helix domain-containing protein 2-like [Paramacrobiotus metropolitanus]|uniref:coiled-coil-helix-coiled-coil-helix domain-containing protein 2-like n=1 Tax=Paramacrobiotus metropolitanus TaxID=2943436 RepID=UPI002445AD75|nr:coiled-coil-helix-coiled-coil-helix domain-containing protein 2-like [Paramacrobiotus metropolitanus]XP_055339726.1 coiled-coil-helix-coiled-coil-helix domain-containing protein 2-like [Paramacrobiotus metropolitanus]
MPRRGGGGRSPSPMGGAPRRSMTTAAPARPAAPPPVPVNPAANAPMAYPAQRQPGMLGQIAGTAAGVAIGSAVGHTIGHALTGGGGSNPREEAVSGTNPQPVGSPGYYQQQAAMTPSYNPCELEMKQFIECAQQNSSDISMCTGFNELLKQCRVRNGMPA